MTTDLSTFSVTNPRDFLEEIFEIDPLAAVRIANKWGTPDATSEQYDVAWVIAQKQTVVQTCSECQWPILEDDPHNSCEEHQRLRAEDDLDDVVDDSVSTTEVYNRAYAHFGNHEMAREATEMYPGDFM